MKGLVTLVLCLCVPALAIADERLILEEGAQNESVQRIENATAAGLTAGLLGYDAYALFRMGYDAKSGGLVDLSPIDKFLGYGGGAGVGLISISMLGLAIHDVVASPVADARDAYAAGDRSAWGRLAAYERSRGSTALHVVGWVSLVFDAGLAAYGLSQLGGDHHDAGVADVWVGGSCAALSVTLLLHTREPVAARTHRQLAVAPSPGGLAIAGTF